MKTALFVFGLLLIAGCLMPTPREMEQELKEGLPEIEMPQEPITVSGNEEQSIVTIRATRVGNEWEFPLEEHEDEFLSVGLHSDSFIRLDNSHLKFLDESESVWLTPMIEDGEGVLFNAIYARNVNCTAENVMILGMEYEKLEDGSSFENDNKWKIGLEKDNGCVNRIIIYMDGYFSKLIDEQISLFRNDSTIVFGFNPEKEVEVTATKPVQKLRIPKIEQRNLREIVQLVFEPIDLPKPKGKDMSFLRNDLRMVPSKPKLKPILIQPNRILEKVINIKEGIAADKQQ